ncbi:hypothetical protein CORC01_10324 [Colletotrichum orchidophilum]|uniref:Tat pathway signal sequence n=1 Tax=Colletotrichum orchidophilum TaxID=1209926 RepID=A0A1G4AZ47_9PEZI|nr:uncharacterized protein CORC01_10324 [Colletotrichum orchidophilum]OHE94396.1 hypothetical protein CORC01_10324 [Colletotrichum orchidophilum]
MSSWVKSHQYAQIEVADESGENGQRKEFRLSQCWQKSRVHLFYAILLVLVAGLSRYTAPNRSAPDYYGVEPVKSELRLPTINKTFELDLKYAMPPSPLVDKAWASLLPKEGGFFQHPALAPNKSCIAVFHQLHCLDLIRQALYEARPDIMEQVNNTSHPADHQADHDASPDHNHVKDMYHIGHCIDLVRQSIICRPDLTVEVGDPAVGGVTGFGTEHQCVNWQELMDWMRDHE